MQGASGRGPGDSGAGVEVVAQAGDGVDGGQRGVDVEEVVDAVAAAGGVVAADRGAQVAVLDGERDEPAGTPGDVPGQRAAKAARADGAVSIRWDGVRGQIQAGGLAVGPGEEVLDPLADRLGVQRAGARRGALTVDSVIEEQAPSGTRRSTRRIAWTTGVIASPACLMFSVAGDGLVAHGQPACLGFEGDQAHRLQRGRGHDERTVLGEGSPQLRAAQPAQVASPDTCLSQQRGESVDLGPGRGVAQLDARGAGQGTGQGLASLLRGQPARVDQPQVAAAGAGGPGQPGGSQSVRGTAGDETGPRDVECVKVRR